MRDKLWRAMRIKSKATIGELLELADEDAVAAMSNAQRYCLALQRAGFLRRLRRAPGTRPTSNGHVRYQLVREQRHQSARTARQWQRLRPEHRETFQQRGDG